MKKAKFRSHMMDKDGDKAQLWDGWTDGEYYYYKANKYCDWQVIHPKVGLKVAEGRTLEEAKANKDARAKMIAEKEASPEWQRMVERWNEVIQQTLAKEAAANEKS